MNGTSRLYRSTSQRMLGGVAAGLASYFGIDPNVVRLIFLVLAFVTGGGFALVYMLLWLLIPGTASTATDVNQIVNENVTDIGAQLRSFTGTKGSHGGNVGNVGNVGTGGIGAEDPGIDHAAVGSAGLDHTGPRAPGPTRRP